SIQDLIVTPVFGAWLGEYFMGLRSGIRDRTAQRGHRSRRDNWLWYLTDPLDLVNIGVSRLLGPEAELSFTPLIGTADQNPGMGTEWPNRYSQAPALQKRSRRTGLGNGERQNFAGIGFNISW
ncbi:MAG: DUF3943 domain-containing protein, partial [Gammaproteobacteria bacterium]|nr:DUF3943 domain-containing protein [Gammaproteobacteria bacterium]